MSSSPSDAPLSARHLDQLRRNVGLYSFRRLAKRAADAGWITDAQFQEALREAEAGGLGHPAEEILLRRGWIDADALESLRREADTVDLRRGGGGGVDALPEEAAQAAGDPASRFGKFLLVREVGRGGMAVVYRAWQLDLGRWVALKILRRPETPTTRRFEQEARIAAKLHHPHLLPVYEFGAERGESWIAMAFAGGGTLAGRRLEAREAAARIIEACEAAQEAHRHGVIHRDIKPSNLLLDENGTLYLGDFGLARSMETPSEFTRSGVFLGTPSFAPPEQIRGDSSRVGPLSDVYGLGATLYALLAGRAPFEAETQTEILQRSLSDDPVPLTRVRPDLPRDLEIICSKALSKEPSRRYDSAAGLAEDLRRFLDGRPILAHPPSLAYRLRKRLRHHAAGISIAGALLAAGGIVAGILGAASRDAGRMKEELSRKEEEVRLADLASRLSQAYGELSLRTKEPMDRLEGAWSGAAPGQVGADLEAVDEAVRVVSEKYPGLQLPKAWSGMALGFAGRFEVNVVFPEACRDAGEDPFPDILMARSLLASYSRIVQLPTAEAQGAGLYIKTFRETPLMTHLRERAAEAARKSAARPVWSRLKQGREYVDYAECARLFSEGDYAAAAARFETLYGDPMLGREAKWLGGLACYLDRRFEAAAGAWEQVGWARSWQMAGQAWSGSSVVDPRADPASEFVAIDRAIACYDKALQLLPGMTGALLGRAVAYGVKGHRLNGRPGFEEALARSIGDYDQILKVEPGHVGSLFGRANALSWLAGSLPGGPRANRSLLDRAIADLQEAARLDPADLDSVLSQGSIRRVLAVSLADAGDDAAAVFAQALADIGGVVERKPDHSFAWSEMALLRAAMAEEAIRRRRDPRPDYRQAIEAYTRALAGNRPHLDHRYGRAKTRVNIAEWLAQSSLDPVAETDRAIEDATEILREKPHLGALSVRAVAWMTRGFGLKVLRKQAGFEECFEKGLADCEEQLRLDPAYANAWFNKGAIYHHLGRYAEALAAYEKCRALRPADAAVQRRIDALRARPPDDF